MLNFAVFLVSFISYHVVCVTEGGNYSPNREIVYDGDLDRREVTGSCPFLSFFSAVSQISVIIQFHYDKIASQRGESISAAAGALWYALALHDKRHYIPLNVLVRENICLATTIRFLPHLNHRRLIFTLPSFPWGSCRKK